ncbi:MAG: carboxylating nicotinate-nucleotide diphosphorylase [Chlorobi bacterium]|nr:MAG: carboxylating nicotinate-nucleotide diphosphorylase [Bacteroidota bacterium]KXK34083.1 MAG: nicotinate-nucleotide pyrophosphorylase [Chlorobi bacterium OLB6]MBE2265118.1 carboxylating nicotinate-nucleotide diphosphorylase [Flavobacteriales bacterium]MBL1161365.1 carboxylating nicotinate-nucleotide diphosphorylase [Chlorobiota bacterium]MBW7852652.1 carboxylating nicotinate-nucleotide diphosphorylase [Candidatus Kapabacteria bacterium]MCC6331088.1 carboxylating nicotinate-nucleotide dip
MTKEAPVPRFPIDSEVIRLIQIAIYEDLGSGDITTELTIDRDTQAAARFVLKSDGVICGLPVLKLVFREFSNDVDLRVLVEEGSWNPAGTVIATIGGRAQALLGGERTALNFIQRLSGVATLTRRYADRLEGTKTRILDTRKTIPGWRLLDKYATVVGGALNHRYGLYDMVMIKDNHITAMGGITEAVTRCVQELQGRSSIRIEVEARSLDEVREILQCEGVHRVMFDNFTPQQVAEGVRIVNGRLETEASGGITYGNIREYADAGVDFVSVGAITHSAAALDISMKLFVPKQA